MNFIINFSLFIKKLINNLRYNLMTLPSMNCCCCSFKTCFQ